MRGVVRRTASFLGCYAFVGVSAAGLLLILAQVSAIRHPQHEMELLGRLKASLHLPIADMFRSSLIGLTWFRMEMHSTWLFLEVFAAVAVSVLLWLIIERYGQGARFGTRETYWMIGFGLVLCCCAMLYGLGTNGVLAKRFPGAASISDAVALCLALIIPAVLWFRWHPAAEPMEEEPDERRASSNMSRTILGLNDDDSSARLIELPAPPPEPPPAPQHVIDLLPVEQHTGSITIAEVLAEPVVVVKPHLSEPTSGPREDSHALERTMSQVMPPAPNTTRTIEDFREQLAGLNARFREIEEIRKDVEEWFVVQQKHALAHIEQHPGLRERNTTLGFTTDFLRESVERVDGEWASIRASVHELSRWLGDGPPEN